MGNIVNRVFDSSGPEGKVRGTPQQIIDKYLMLARDAQLSNDRVAEQNFLQHAEHYTRMLGEAQREMAREQEARQAQSQAQQGGGEGGGQQQQPQQQGRERREGRGEGRSEEQRRDTGPADVIEIAEEEGSGLVETPETRPEPQPEETREKAAEGGERPRRERPRTPRRRSGGGGRGSDEPTPESSAAE